MPRSYLSDSQWTALEASRNKVPKYLFRAFGEGSGGGGKELNSCQGVIPRAFANGNGHRDIREIEDLRDMLIKHLYTMHGFETEFSSWAASLALVLTYAAKFKNGYVCVLDRTLLPDVTIYHVPDLNKTIGTFHDYPAEYLAHGRVEGPGFKAVSVRRLRDSGTWQAIPIIRQYVGKEWWLANGVRWKNHPVVAIEVKEVATMRQIAEHFGSNFTVVMTAALLSITRRKRDKTGALLQSDLQAFRAGLDKLSVCLFAETSIFTHDVYVDGFEVVAQMMDLLQGLIG